MSAQSEIIGSSRIPAVLGIYTDWFMFIAAQISGKYLSLSKPAFLVIFYMDSMHFHHPCPSLPPLLSFLFPFSTSYPPHLPVLLFFKYPQQVQSLQLMCAWIEGSPLEHRHPTRGHILLENDCLP